MRRGFFVVIEGLDASGKSTLVRDLTAAYRREGVPITTVREPGGTRLSEQVRRILLDTRDNLTSQAELFLYLASRSQLIEEVIRPALVRGELVLSDRFSLSTLAYQIGGRGLPAREVISADRLARNGIAPNLTIVLTVSEAEARRRKSKGRFEPDRMERESPAFFRKVRAEYRRRTGNRRGMCVIDSSIGVDQVFAKAKTLIDRRLRRYHRV
ncbi:MAG: dTMP kinase [Candidatus Zixiibacteriota bacterium]